MDSSKERHCSTCRKTKKSSHFVRKGTDKLCNTCNECSVERKERRDAGKQKSPDAADSEDEARRVLRKRWTPESDMAARLFFKLTGLTPRLMRDFMEETLCDVCGEMTEREDPFDKSELSYIPPEGVSVFDCMHLTHLRCKKGQYDDGQKETEQYKLQREKFARIVKLVAREKEDEEERKKETRMQQEILKSIQRRISAQKDKASPEKDDSD